MVRLEGQETARSLWCTIEVNSKKLLCYQNALDIVLGQEPKHEFDLESAEVQPVASDQPEGFSLHELVEASQEDAPTDKEPEYALRHLASFVVEEPGNVTEWHHVLQMLCAASALQNTYDLPLGSRGGDLTPPAAGSSMTSEDDVFSKLVNMRPSCAPRGDGPPSEQGPRIANLLPNEEVDEDVSRANDQEAGKAAGDSEKDVPAGAGPEAAARAPSDGDSDDSSAVIPEPGDSDVSSDGEEVEDEHQALSNLRYLVRTLRVHKRALNEDLKAAEYAAKTTLGYFDEQAAPGRALAELQAMLAQVADFSDDFEAAVKKVRDTEDAAARPKARRLTAKAKVQAAVHQPAVHQPAGPKRPPTGGRKDVPGNAAARVRDMLESSTPHRLEASAEA